MPYQIEELPREKNLRDPVHGYVHVQHQFILDLIDTKEFQRLRRIKQLGTSLFTFHGAEHSRFSHSLGVYELARRICDKLNRNYPSKEPGDGLWNDGERPVVLAAALLHDLGHGPFSHIFEGIFNTNHEEITMEIILSPETEVNQVLRSISPNFPEDVASVINKTYPNPQVVQLISSQIDADRMDYLLRDAYFTGVSYGQYDLTRIIRVIRPTKRGIAFDISGMHAVEDYIVSRYQMYMQVYFHPVSRGMEVILTSLLQRANDLYKEGKLDQYFTFSMLKPFFDQNWTLADYLDLDDGVLMSYFAHWRHLDDEILNDLANRFLDRKPFKSVQFNSLKDKDKLEQMRNLIKSMGYNPDYYTAINSSYDLPYDFYRPYAEEPRTQIELIEKNGQVTELSERSTLVDALTGRHNRDERFFYPNELNPKVDNNISLFQDDLNEFHDLVRYGKL